MPPTTNPRGRCCLVAGGSGVLPNVQAREAAGRSRLPVGGLRRRRDRVCPRHGRGRVGRPPGRRPAQGDTGGAGKARLVPGKPATAPGPGPPQGRDFGEQQGGGWWAPESVFFFLLARAVWGNQAHARVRRRRLGVRRRDGGVEGLRRPLAACLLPAYGTIPYPGADCQNQTANVSRFTVARAI